MQIHELNNFTGTLGSGAYLAIDDGNDTGKISSQGLLAATEARIDNIIAGPAPSAEEIVDARLGDDGVTYPSLGDAIRDQFSDVKSDLSVITQEMVKIESNNLVSDGFVSGYMAKNGSTYTSSSYKYTKKKIPVSEGDVIKFYALGGGVFESKPMRFMCAFDSSGAVVSSAGDDSGASIYTIPSGVASIIVSVAEGYTDCMITKNYAPSAYEAYFAPYYIASNDFVANALAGYEVPETTVKGYNLLPAAEDGVGYYYGSAVGSPILFGSSSSYHYAVVPVEKNTDYYISQEARFWAFTDDDDIVTSFGELGKFINSGNGTKLYYSVSATVWSYESSYGTLYAIIIAKGTHGTYNNVKKPSFVSGITQNMMEAKYGCALPKQPPRFTVGFEQVWYTDNMLALENNKVFLNPIGYSTYVDGGIKFSPASAAISSNNYAYRVYDERLACIDQRSQLGNYRCADNVQNCSVLVIGDSTVAQNYMTQTMLDAFTERSKTLTLLGTRGTAPNNHEGRAGWSAKEYCTVASKGGVTNAFYNTGTSKFDFSYYMTNQGYSAPDFVVIQLGINDLYGADFESVQSTIETTADYIVEIIDSIRTYNPSQKILLNLPTALNNDQTKQSSPLFLLRNKFVRYNDYIQYRLYDEDISKIRFSNCHLILNPNEDISDDVHPTVAGYTKMGMEVVSQINCWQNNY